MLIDYVGFTLSERRMREQFASEPEPAPPRRGQRIHRLSSAPLRRSLAMLLREAADRLEPARHPALAADSSEA